MTNEATEGLPDLVIGASKRCPKTFAHKVPPTGFHTVEIPCVKPAGHHHDCSDVAMITECSIRIRDKVYSLPAGRFGRHGYVYQAMARACVTLPDPDAVEGFKTWDGVFLDRADAEYAARAIQQLRGPVLGGFVLTSEDLW